MCINTHLHATDLCLLINLLVDLLQLHLQLLSVRSRHGHAGRGEEGRTHMSHQHFSSHGFACQKYAIMDIYNSFFVSKENEIQLPSYRQPLITVKSVTFSLLGFIFYIMDNCH